MRFFLFALVLFPIVATAEDPPPGEVYKMKVSADLPAVRFQLAPADPTDLNALISHPCFIYSKETPYCMPQKGGEKGFVCSGQSASVVAHLRSLGLKASPFYLDWSVPSLDPETKKTKLTPEAHAMVVVPFENKKKQSCHHVLEVARQQPVVEFACCHTDARISEAESLRVCTMEHFVNPPQKVAKGLPLRTPLDREHNEKTFSAKRIDRAYDITDRFNPGTPIWTLEEKKWACPNGLCKKHEITKDKHIIIDQTRVTPGDSSTFSNTEIIVNYDVLPLFDCRSKCRAEDCILNQTKRPAPNDMPVIWPPTKATCETAAAYRSYIVNPAFTCRAICETVRPGYQGGSYIGAEPRMSCPPRVHVVNNAPAPAPPELLHRTDGAGNVTR